jgi:hypothetical protein
MKVQEDGSYKLDDGRVIPADQIGKLHTETTRKVMESPQKPQRIELSEGEVSGIMRLED